MHQSCTESQCHVTEHCIRCNMVWPCDYFTLISEIEFNGTLRAYLQRQANLYAMPDKVIRSILKYVNDEIKRSKR